MLIRVETTDKNFHWGDALSMDFEDKRKMYDLGFWNETNNNSLKAYPSDEIIMQAADILQKYYGRLTKYMIWECAVCGFRIMFGN